MVSFVQVDPMYIQATFNSNWINSMEKTAKIWKFTENKMKVYRGQYDYKVDITSSDPSSLKQDVNNMLLNYYGFFVFYKIQKFSC